MPEAAPCSCVQIARGAYVLVFTLWFAWWCPQITDGYHFWSLAYDFVTVPIRTEPAAFALWLVFLVVGIERMLAGINQSGRDGDNVNIWNIIPPVVGGALMLHFRGFAYAALPLPVALLVVGHFMALTLSPAGDIYLWLTAKVRRRRILEKAMIPPTLVLTNKDWRRVYTSQAGALADAGGKINAVLLSNAQFAALLNQLRNHPPIIDGDAVEITPQSWWGKSVGRVLRLAGRPIPAIDGVLDRFRFPA